MDRRNFLSMCGSGVVGAGVASGVGGAAAGGCEGAETLVEVVNPDGFGGPSRWLLTDHEGASRRVARHAELNRRLAEMGLESGPELAVGGQVRVRFVAPCFLFVASITERPTDLFWIPDGDELSGDYDFSGGEDGPLDKWAAFARALRLNRAALATTADGDDLTWHVVGELSERVEPATFCISSEGRYGECDISVSRAVRFLLPTADERRRLGC